MSDPGLQNLAPDVLRSRLAELALEERRLMVEFLSCLAEFDRREGYLPLGFPSLFEFLVKELHF